MINSREPLSMSESEEYIKGNENAIELEKFVKKFSRIDVKKAKELRKKIEELNFVKIKPENISKIIDLLPEAVEDLNKIFVDISLDENETQSILNTVKQYIK
jgi:DNA-directed RNA polymerase subunit F